MRQPLAVFILKVDGAQVPSTTGVERAGAAVVAVSTGVAELGLEVHSSYLGARSAPTHATHLTVARGAGEHSAAEHAAGDLPVDRSVDKLVLDHAFVVRRAVERMAGGEVELHVDERRLQAAAG